MTFTGTPPEGSHGTVEVEIVAHDQFGNQATATFQITVGRESKDIEQMLSHLHATQPGAHAPQPAHDGGARHEHDGGARHRHDGPPHKAGALQGAGRTAFTAQLRDAGPIGKILQARRMVHSVVGAVAGHGAEPTS